VEELHLRRLRGRGRLLGILIISRVDHQPLRAHRDDQDGWKPGAVRTWIACHHESLMKTKAAGMEGGQGLGYAEGQNRGALRPIARQRQNRRNVGIEAGMTWANCWHAQVSSEKQMTAAE